MRTNKTNNQKEKDRKPNRQKLGASCPTSSQKESLPSEGEAEGREAKMQR